MCVCACGSERGEKSSRSRKSMDFNLSSLGFKKLFKEVEHLSYQLCVWPNATNVIIFGSVVVYKSGSLESSVKRYFRQLVAEPITVFHFLANDHYEYSL